MAQDAYFTFFFDLAPRMDKKAFDEFYKTLNDQAIKLDEADKKRTDENIKDKESRYKSYFLLMEKQASALAMKMSAFTTILGTLSVLKFNNIKDFADDLKQTRGDAEKTFNFLNASNRVAGVSSNNVIGDISSLYASKRQLQATGMNDRASLNLIGASLTDDVDVILDKYQKTIRSMNAAEQNILTERLGLSKDTMRLARLSEQELKDLSKLGFYNKQNIEKLEQTAQATKELFGSLGNLKDKMIISFSPLIISILSSIKGALESKQMERILNSLSGFGEDIALFNNTLKGIPFKALLGVLLLEYAVKHRILTAITIAASVVQDVYNGIKDIFGFKAKKSTTASVFRSIVNNSPTFDEVPIASFFKNGLFEDGSVVLNKHDKNAGVVNNNGTTNNNVVINIDVKGNAGRNTANDIAREVKRVVDNNNSRLKNMSDKR